MATSIVQFKQTLTQMIERQDLSLPSTVTPEAFRNAAIVAVQTNPSILNCAPDSVFTALRHLAGMGLVPDNREAAIVPFKGRAQAQAMVDGLVKVVKQSGHVTSIFAEVVYEGEEVEVWLEDGERKFNHVRAGGGRLNPMDRGGNVIGAYAVAKLRDGTVEFQAMRLEDIEKRRRVSPNQKGDKPTGIWADWYEEMARKTAIRALCKRLPMSREDASRILDNDPAFREVPMRDVTPAETTEERLSRLAAERAGKSAARHVAPEFDESLADPASDAFDEGVVAFQSGVFTEDNPHHENPKYSNWLAGWMQAKAFEDGVSEASDG